VTEFDDWLDGVRTRHLRDMDTVILICGKERKGKSTLSFKLARMIDPSFDHTRMVFAATDLIKLATELPKGSAIVLDEAIIGGFSRDAMAKQNKDFVKFLVICGERNLVLFINFPKLKNVDSYIRGRMHYWILLPEDAPRGFAIIHRPLPTDYPWAKDHMKQVVGFNYGHAEDDPEWGLYLKQKSKMVVDRAESTGSAGAIDPFIERFRNAHGVGGE
jgi:hypothetical protein